MRFFLIIFAGLLTLNFGSIPEVFAQRSFLEAPNQNNGRDTYATCTCKCKDGTQKTVTNAYTMCSFPACAHLCGNFCDLHGGVADVDWETYCHDPEDSDDPYPFPEEIQ